MSQRRENLRSDLKKSDLNTNFIRHSANTKTFTRNERNAGQLGTQFFGTKISPFLTLKLPKISYQNKKNEMFEQNFDSKLSRLNFKFTLINKNFFNFLKMRVFGNNGCLTFQWPVLPDDSRTFLPNLTKLEKCTKPARRLI
jgi:hypothetical protein